MSFFVKLKCSEVLIQKFESNILIGWELTKAAWFHIANYRNLCLSPVSFTNFLSFFIIKIIKGSDITANCDPDNECDFFFSIIMFKHLHTFDC